MCNVTLIKISRTEELVNHKIVYTSPGAFLMFVYCPWPLVALIMEGQTAGVS
jgi:hypothetical protein